MSADSAVSISLDFLFTKNCLLDQSNRRLVRVAVTTSAEAPRPFWWKHFDKVSTSLGTKLWEASGLGVERYADQQTLDMQFLRFF